MSTIKIHFGNEMKYKCAHSANTILRGAYTRVRKSLTGKITSVQEQHDVKRNEITCE